MKRILCLSLVVCLLMGIVPFRALAVGDSVDRTPQAYPFRFTGALVTEDVTGTCYYSDSYFLKDASVYDPQLATMSLCFELTTWARAVQAEGWGTDVSGADREDSDMAWQNAYDLLDRLGFRAFAVNAFWATEPTRDSIGAVAAAKTLDDDAGTLIALGIRGGGYGQEWSSNFLLGEEGEHQGFAKARDDVLDFLREYIRDNGIQGKIKLWIVGYSRAGCVANMVAGQIDSGHPVAEDVSLAHEDLFAYTFAAPKGTTLEAASEGDYSNIHNIISLNDLVPLVAPGSWGFTRYASDRYLPTAMTSGDFDAQLEAMLSHYRTFEGDTTYKIREYGTRYTLQLDLRSMVTGGEGISIREDRVPNSVLLEEATSFLFDDVIGDRQTYCDDLQDSFCQVMALLNGGSLDSDATAEDVLQQILGELTAQTLVDMVSPMIVPGSGDPEAEVRADVDAAVEDILEDPQIWGTVTFAEELKTALSDLIWRLLEAVTDDLSRGDTDSLQSLVNAISMVTEGGLLQAHYPEITLAWLMSQDSNYGVAQTAASDGSYRAIRVDGAADITVSRVDTGAAVARFRGDIPEQPEGSSIHAYLEDGEKVILLPGDVAYQVQITATDRGWLDYGVETYTLPDKEKTGSVLYEDLWVRAGDVLTGQVPQQTEGAAPRYTLVDSDGELLETSGNRWDILKHFRETVWKSGRSYTRKKILGRLYG